MHTKEQLAIEWKSLQDEAQRLVRDYWDKALRANDIGPYSERNKYGVRVRKRKTTISIEWFLNVLSGPSWERRHRAFYVSRGKGYAYPLSRFSKSSAAWEKQAPIRQKLSPILAAMYSTTGEVTRFMHIWPYPDLITRANTRQTAIETKVWPPAGGPDQLVTMHNDIYLPAAFSPIR